MSSAIGLKKLVLLGAGFAHLQTLRELARNRPADLTVTLVAPVTRPIYAAMVPGFVAGDYTREDMTLPLDRVIERSGARFIQASCVGLDPMARTVTLSDGQELPFTVLGVDIGAPYDRDAIEADMPGARLHALPLRPLESFVQLWPHIAGMAREKAMHIAVVGGGASGVEIALAASRQARVPNRGRVTLVTGGPEPLFRYPEPVRARAMRALRREGITILRERCIGFAPGEVLLANGARLVTDAPVLATSSRAPTWLVESGLTLNDEGRIVVNAFQQSVSHLRVLAGGDACAREDLVLPYDGVTALRTGTTLAANLRAALYDQALVAHKAPPKSLNLLVSGQHRAIATWGGWSGQGWWAWRWKDRMDRRFVREFAGQG